MVTPTSAAAAAASAADRHKKIYLCAAPRPPDFDVLTESVLRGLGSSRAENVISTTLDRIQNQHQWQRKSGPGRKSNAEHAIHFYEHLLEQVQARAASKAREEAAKKNKQEGGTNDEDNTAATESAKSSPWNEKRREEGDAPALETPSHHYHHAEDDYPRENRSDQCDVCDEKSGRLMVCTSCGLAFHLDCVRPVMTEFPTEPDWRCAYCWLATEPKNSKKRRESAAAVRLMARLRNGNRRRRARQAQEGGGVEQFTPPSTVGAAGEGAADDDDGKSRDESTVEEDDGGAKKTETLDESKPAAEEPATAQSSSNDDKKEAPESNSSEGPAGDNKGASKSPTDAPKKRKLALLKLADAFTGEVPPCDDDAGRGKRSRKQPTLYDPQVSVPARHWQSDEVLPSDDSESDDDDESESPSTRHTVAEGDVWCSFCNDDNMIKLCCFCGCRRCFGKHKKAKLLICDECEEEYHTFCLSPPLDSPPSRKWYCPNCKKSAKSGEKTSRREAAAAPSSPLPARKSARMPTVVEPLAPPPLPPAAFFQLPRKRGRPPKKPEAIAAAMAAAQAAAAAAAAAAANPPKRKRGRPPKNAPPVLVVSPPRKRGRPPNKPPPPLIVPDKPKPLRAADGRFISPKRDSIGSETQGRHSTGSLSGKSKSKVEIRELPAPVIHVSRSGRTVKRTSFHDEIEEGDQHLRSERSAYDGRPFEHEPGALVRQVSSKSSPPSAPASGSVAASAMPNRLLSATGAVATPTSAKTASQANPLIFKADGTQATGDVMPRVGSVSVPGATTMGTFPVDPTRPMQVAQAPGGQQTVPAAALNVAASAGSAVPKVVGGAAGAAGVPAAAVAASGRPSTESAGDLDTSNRGDTKMPRRKPGARECVQISRRFGIRVIPEKYSEILLDYCSRGKVEHLIRMRERLDEHSRFLELQLAGLEQLVKEKGASNVVVPVLPEGPDRKLERTLAGDNFEG